MKMRTVRYYLSEGIRNLFKNSIMSVAAIIIVATSIFMLAIAYGIVVNISFGLQQIERDVPISVIIEQGITEEETRILYERILGIENVTYVEYTSAAEALERWREQLGDEHGILGGLTYSNPLPSSFTITSEHVEHQQGIINELNFLNRQLGSIETVRHAQGVVEALVNINRVMGVISAIVVVGLSVFSTVIIMNTIRLAVNNRKNEIQIMKYVGATDWFIKWPFVIEGVVIGLIGVSIAMLVSYLGYNGAQNALHSSVPLIENMAFQTRGAVFVVLIPLAAILGSAIGFIGSYVSVQKYLNV